MAEEGTGARLKVAERKQDPGEIETRGEEEKMRETWMRERDEDEGEAGLYICGGMWSFLKVRGGPCIIPPPDPPGHWASTAGVCWPTPPGDPGRHPQGRESRLRAGHLHLIRASGADWMVDVFFYLPSSTVGVCTRRGCAVHAIGTLYCKALHASDAQPAIRDDQKKNARICQDALMLAD